MIITRASLQYSATFSLPKQNLIILLYCVPSFHLILVFSCVMSLPICCFELFPVVAAANAGVYTYEAAPVATLLGTEIR
jgi:hypothetical protein